MKTAIYALSGDPITCGHIDIIKRSAQAFDKLIVALGINPDKKYLLTADERLAVAKQSLSYLPNVEVVFFKGLLADFAFEQNANVIIRGVRNAEDVTFEQSLNQINSTQINIDTFLMFADPKLSHISSSSVKAIQKENGLIHEYVPLPVKKILERKISDQVIIGITGVMGSGKSYVAERLVALSHDLHNSDSSNPLVYNIELDKLAHRVFTEDKPAYARIRDRIREHFGTLDRKTIGEIAFDSDDNFHHVEFLNKIFEEPVKVLLRQELREKKGIILINSAILIESNLLNLCNNHIVLVDADREVRHERLLKYRNIDPAHAEKRIKHMKSTQSKFNTVKKEIERTHFGQIVKFNNTASEEQDFIELYNQLKQIYA